LFNGLKKWFTSVLSGLQEGVKTILGSLKRTPSPLVDRIMADALRLAELPSPTDGETERIRFIKERLDALGIQSLLDEGGLFMGPSGRGTTKGRGSLASVYQCGDCPLASDL